MPGTPAPFRKHAGILFQGAQGTSVAARARELSANHFKVEHPLVNTIDSGESLKIVSSRVDGQ